MDFNTSAFRHNEFEQPDHQSSATVLAVFRGDEPVISVPRHSGVGGTIGAKPPSVAYRIEPPLLLQDDYKRAVQSAFERANVSVSISAFDTPKCTAMVVSNNRSAGQLLFEPPDLEEILTVAHRAADEGTPLTSKVISEKVLAGLVSVIKGKQITHRASIRGISFVGQPMCRSTALTLRGQETMQGTVLCLDPLRGEMGLTARGHLYRVRFLDCDLDVDARTVLATHLNIKQSPHKRLKIYEAMREIAIGTVVSVTAIQAGALYLVPFGYLESLHILGADYSVNDERDADKRRQEMFDLKMLHMPN